jgi:hypothetical protein
MPSFYSRCRLYRCPDALDASHPWTISCSKNNGCSPAISQDINRRTWLTARREGFVREIHRQRLDEWRPYRPLSGRISLDLVGTLFACRPRYGIAKLPIARPEMADAGSAVQARDVPCAADAWRLRRLIGVAIGVFRYLLVVARVFGISNRALWWRRGRGPISPCPLAGQPLLAP